MKHNYSSIEHESLLMHGVDKRRGKKHCQILNRLVHILWKTIKHDTGR